MYLEGISYPQKHASANIDISGNDPWDGLDRSAGSDSVVKSKHCDTTVPVPNSSIVPNMYSVDAQRFVQHDLGFRTNSSPCMWV